MEGLLSSDAIGGGSLAGAATEKMMDKKVGKDTCCPTMSIRVRAIGFLVCFVLGKYKQTFAHLCSLPSN